MTQQDDWATQVGSNIAAELRRHRKAQGLSAQQLADRCAELGHNIPRSVISNFESGRRTNVTVAELLVLSRALTVAPAALVFPAGFVEEVEVLPGVVADPLSAIQWLGGETALPGGEEDSLAELLKSVIFHMRQIHRALAETRAKEAQISDLVRVAATSDPSLKESYDRTIRDLGESCKREVERVSSLVALLKSGLPELGIDPVPFPKVSAEMEKSAVEFVGAGVGLYAAMLESAASMAKKPNAAEE